MEVPRISANDVRHTVESFTMVARFASTRALAGALLLALIGAPARADLIRLRSGQLIDGKVTHRDSRRVVVQARYGEVVLDAREVLSIETRPTVDEEFEVEARLTVMDDPDDVERLAAWSAARGMLSKANELQARAAALREEAARRAAEERARAMSAALLARRQALLPGDGEGLYRLAMWAEGEGYAQEVVDRLLRESLLADPANARARVAEELRRKQAEANEALAAAERSRTQATRELERAEALRREAEAREANARAREARVAAAEATIDMRLEAARDAEARARASEGRARELEARARAEAEQAAAIRRELEAELRALRERSYREDC